MNIDPEENETVNKPTMKRIVLQSRILETLGAPLIAAVGDVVKRQAPENDNSATPRTEAEQTASLLAKTIQVSLLLSNSMDIRDSEGEAGSVRLALTALSASLIAGHYRQTGEIPDDNDLKRLITALEAVLTFSDNFIVSDESNIRLELLASGDIRLDGTQMNIQFINTLIPVVNAVAVFSFGQPEQKLVSDITERLIQRMYALYSAWPTEDIPDREKRRAELSLLKGLVEIYVQCHKDATDKLTATDKQGQSREGSSEATVASVWESFETRVSMLDTLTKATAQQAKNQPTSTSEAPSPVTTTQPAEEIAPAQKQEEGTQDNDSKNPMSFFKPGAAKPEDKAGETEE